MDDKYRVVCWFSCGATSAVAAKLALKEHADDNVIIAYCDTGSEHPDNMRFLKDCEKWYGQEIIVLKHPKYNNIWDVFESRKYLKSQAGAPCTLHLKKEVRKNFQLPEDIQVFGYTADEIHRVNRFKKENPNVDLYCPLIERELTSANCKAILEKEGIKLPAMYMPQKSGTPYGHNNCIGCVKGGMGYWNKIRIDFPEQFARMAKLERQLNFAITGTFLDELEPSRGNFNKEEDIYCDLLCSISYQT